jgi:hypothetical protein
MLKYKNKKLELEIAQKQEKSNYFNSAEIKKRFSHISHDHKHINASNVVVTLFPDCSPKKLTPQELADIRSR